MNRKEKLDSSKYCPDSCDSLYGDKCIMQLNGNYNGGHVLFYELIKLHRRYIRREDCPLEDTHVK